MGPELCLHLSVACLTFSVAKAQWDEYSLEDTWAVLVGEGLSARENGEGLGELGVFRGKMGGVGEKWPEKTSR